MTYSASAPATFQNPANSGTDDYSGDPFSVNSGCNWGHEQDSNGNIVSTSGECHATATLTAHFVWHPSYPGELPPKCAVVYETADASYFLGPGSKYRGGSGNCASTLDHETLTQGIINQTVISEFKHSYRYSVKQNPGYSFDKTCTPTANAQGTGPDPNVYAGSGQARISVSYKAEAAPVEINLSGAIRNGSDYSIMIGQGLTASISCSLCYSFDSWLWLTDGDTFKNWYADEHSTLLEYLDEDDTTTNVFHLYFSKPAEAVKISCSSSVTFPGGDTGTVEAEKNLTVVGPDSEYNEAFPGKVEVNDQLKVIRTLFDPNSGDPEGANNSTHGITWYGKWKTPIPFSMAQGNGNWHFVQNIDFGRWHTPQGGSEVPDEDGVGHPGLDTHYSFSHLMPNSTYTNGITANGMRDSRYDSPGQPLFASSVSHRIQEPFETWVMFKPPSANPSYPDEMWVPVYKFTWHWQGLATRTNMQSMWDGSGVIALDSRAENHTFPSWTFRLVNGKITP